MNYEKKYLKYKMKYLELQTGGLFGSKPDPTPLTRYPNTTILESKEINIDGINTKVDKIVYKKSPENYQEYGMDFPLNTIIILSFSNKPGKKNYIPYFEFRLSNGSELHYIKEKVYTDFFNKLSPDILKAYDEVVNKYSKMIIIDFKPVIDKKIDEITQIINKKEIELKELVSKDIAKLKEEEKEKRKIEITSYINKEIEKLNLEIQKFEQSKIKKIEESNKYIESTYQESLQRNISSLNSNISKIKSDKERIASYLI
jgi:hypothetical protein